MYQDFLDYIEIERGGSPDTLSAYASDLKLFWRFAGEHGVTCLAQVSHTLIRRWITDQQGADNPRFGKKGLSEGTIKRRLASVSSYIEYVKATSDEVIKNPIKQIRFRRRSKPEAQPIGELTLDLLMTSLVGKKRDRAMFDLVVATGLRLSEVHQLNRDSIMVSENSKGKLTGSGSVIGKGSKRRTFHVDHVTALLLLDYLETRKDQNPALFLSERKTRLSKRAIQQTWSTLCARLSAPISHIHQLRHTFATKMVNHDMPVTKLMELMGHQSLSTTMGYYKLDEAKLAASFHAAMEHIR